MKCADNSLLRALPPVLGMVLFALAALGMGCATAEPKNPADDADVLTFPQEVREAVDRAARLYPQPLTGAHWSKLTQLSGTDHPLYQVEGTNGRGNKIEMEVTSAGRIIEVEEHGVPLSEVPAAVTAALKINRPQFTPTLAEAIYQNGQAQPVSYGFEGTDAKGRKQEVYVSADGKTFLN